ncbi:hypothetical protein AB0A73_24580 [Glycomyces sp. NPDC047369]
MAASEHRVRILGARRTRIDLRALADLLVAAADSDPAEHARDAGPAARWQPTHHTNGERSKSTDE